MEIDERPPTPPSPGGDERKKKSKPSLPVSPSKSMKSKKRDHEKTEDTTVHSAYATGAVSLAGYPGHESPNRPCPTEASTSHARETGGESNLPSVKSPLKKKLKYDPNANISSERGVTSFSQQGQSESSASLGPPQIASASIQVYSGEGKTPGNTQNLEMEMESINIGPLDQAQGALSRHSQESIPNVFTSPRGKKIKSKTPIKASRSPSVSSPGSQSGSRSVLSPPKLNLDSFSSRSPNSSMLSGPSTGSNWKAKKTDSQKLPESSDVGQSSSPSPKHFRKFFGGITLPTYSSRRHVDPTKRDIYSVASEEIIEDSSRG